MFLTTYNYLVFLCFYSYTTIKFTIRCTTLPHSNLSPRRSMSFKPHRINLIARWYHFMYLRGSHQLSIIKTNLWAFNSHMFISKLFSTYLPLLLDFSSFITTPCQALNNKNSSWHEYKTIKFLVLVVLFLFKSVLTSIFVVVPLFKYN